MNCENSFCVYWSENECTLKQIFLDIQGCCQSCIYINIEEEYLYKKREELLNRYENWAEKDLH